MTAIDDLLGGRFVLRARQLLTMDGDRDLLRQAPPAGLDALRERDAAITGLIEDGAVVVNGQDIQWVGPWAELPAKARELPAIPVACLTPGWVDCHTHAVFAGSRHDEFTLRNQGADYLDILASGGGILSTVNAVRRANRRALAEALLGRCVEATRLGVTTLEVKSGYGLSTGDEIKQLRAIDMVRPETPMDLQATFLGAHAIPMKYRERRDDYVKLVCDVMIPKVAEQNLARFCDVFCDKGAFTAAEAERVLRAGLDHGLIPRLHADELSHAGAAELAADIGAASADHLEHVSPAAIAAMAEAGVVAVLLPVVPLFLGLKQRAPARRLLEAGVPVALSTDFNPGTAMTQDLGLVMTLACLHDRMTPGEALLGVTREAAGALRLPDRGVLKAGQRADLTVLQLEDYWQLPYTPGSRPVVGVIQGGELAYWTTAQEVED